MNRRDNYLLPYIWLLDSFYSSFLILFEHYYQSCSFQLRLLRYHKVVMQLYISHFSQLKSQSKYPEILPFYLMASINNNDI